nr:hypothetical protein [uncultured archaeon]
MKLELRSGSRVYPDEIEKNIELSSLSKLGFITIEKDIVYNCPKCGQQQFNSKINLLEKTYYCPCGCIIPNPITDGEDIRIIKAINFIKVKNYIFKVLQKQKINAQYDPHRKLFFLNELNNIKVIIIGYSICLDLLYADEGKNCLFINLNVTSGIVYPWRGQIIDILDLDTLKLKTIIASIPINLLLESTENELKFQKVLDRGDRYFEKDFVSFLVTELRKRDEKIKALILRLGSSNSLLNAKTILLGMAGKSDFYLLPIGEYLSDGLNPNRFGEVKAYGKDTLFSFEDFAKAQAHAAGQDILCIVGCNKIQQEVWSNLIERRTSEKYFKFVVLDQELILMLINVLEIDLDELLNIRNELTN